MESQDRLLQCVAGPPIDQAEAVIVFVHGLGGSWEKVWATRHRSHPWPQSLLSRNFPTTRIFTYGFNVMNDIGDDKGSLSKDLRYSLEDLLDNRIACRPIVFVTHSIGGIIVQDALLNESRSKDSWMSRWTTGLIFLGCPCFRLDDEWMKFGTTIGRMTKAAKEPNKVKLKQLATICGNFASWLETSPANKPSVWYFHEIYPVYDIGTIVPRESARIDVDQSSPLPSDHISLAIVDGPWDPHYYSICERLKEMCRMSKEDSEVPGNRRSESQDSREKILDILEKDDVVRRLMRLALVLDDQGHPKHAEEAYEEVIEKRRETPRQEDRVLLFCQGKLSSILRKRGLYTKAEDQCRRVLDLSLGFSGPTSSLSLQTAGDLALVWRDQGKFDIAYNKIRDILDNETCSPYQDALHVRLVTIFAIILRDCGHYDMSLFLTRNALRVSDALFGNEDPFTLDLASELSQILTEKSFHRLAEEFARRALDGFAKTFGTDHPQSLKAASRLANAMRFEERLGDATELFERTLKAQELQLGSAHPDTVPTKCGLAATYALEARFRDSESILRQTLDQQNAVFGQNSHPDRDWTLQALQSVRAFQRALNTDSTSESEMKEESRRMRDFFKRPFRKDQRNLQLYDDITLSKKNTGEVQSQNHLQRIAAIRNVSTDFKNIFPSSSDKASVSGICGTTLHAACFTGDPKRVLILLNSGEDINAEGGIFETPLRAASYGGHINIVNLLLKHDANVKDYGKYGFSALQLASSMGHHDLARTLLDAGANPEATDHWYGTILHEASMTGQEYMVNLLLEAKAKPNAVTGIFGTALGAAAWKGNLTIVQSLIGKGAIVNTQVEGRTALDLAASEGHQDIMEALIRAADDGNETLKPKEKSEPLEQKPLEPDKPLVEDLEPKEKSEPLEQKPLKPLKPTKPQKERLIKHPSPNPSKKSMPHRIKLKALAGKTQAGKKQAELIRFAKGVKSETKSRIGF